MELKRQRVFIAPADMKNPNVPAYETGIFRPVFSGHGADTQKHHREEVF